MKAEPRLCWEVNTASQQDTPSAGCHKKPVLRRDPSLQHHSPHVNYTNWLHPDCTLGEGLGSCSAFSCTPNSTGSRVVLLGRTGAAAQPSRFLPFLAVPVLFFCFFLMPREKDGALQTARTSPNFIERKAVLKDCKCSIVSRIFTCSVRHPLVFRTAQNAGHTGFQNTYMTFIVWNLLGLCLKALVLVHSCQNLKSSVVQGCHLKRLGHKQLHFDPISTDCQTISDDYIFST